MPQFRKKPVVIDAFKLGHDCMPDWFREAIARNEIYIFGEIGAAPHAKIKTLEGVMSADAGEYVIRGVKGEIYPCKPDIFEATYEPA